jgi:hypothetical protein
MTAPPAVASRAPPSPYAEKLQRVAIRDHLPGSGVEIAGSERRMHPLRYRFLCL